MPTRAAIAQLLSGSPPRVGPFRIVAELGEGGFAPVFLAAEEYGGVELRTVALKLFSLDDLAGSVSAAEATRAHARIVEEARALCRVEHPNVVRFHQMLEAPGRVLALAMEHLRGRSLGDRLHEEHTLPLSVTLEIGAAIASALTAVHGAGLVHRDVKPDNVIDAGGVFKLIDFGIAARARVLDPHSVPRVSIAASSRSANPSAAPSAVVVSVVTRKTETARDLVRVTDASERTVRAPDGEDGTGTDAVAGTMGYIDPVCLAHGEPADASSDLYALGAMLYECLSGQMPASEGAGDASVRLRMNVAMGLAEPTPLRELAPSVPAAVARLIDSLVTPARKLRPQRAEWVACELERLRRLERGTARSLPEAPFRGLKAFDERHRDVYFGRAADVASAIELLRRHGVVALVGPSGSGKSSLARAGVLPAVADGALGAWPPAWTMVATSPGADPRAAIAAALLPVMRGASLPEHPDELAAALAEIVTRSNTGIVLLVDALEELVTLAEADERPYLAMLLAAISLHPLPGVRAVVTARRDLLDPLLAVPALGVALTRGVQLVAPLTAAAWVNVVADRLAAYGFALENDALRDALGRELAETAEAMPLVEFALDRLWAERDIDRRMLTHESLTRIGGLAGALGQHAEATLAALVKRDGPRAADVAGDVLLALTTPHGTRATRRIEDVERDVRDPLCGRILAAFEKERLLVVEEGRVTLAHDALIARWPRLSAWVESMRRDREIANQLEEVAGRWRARRERDLLLRGGPLRDARRLTGKVAANLSSDARVFVAASRRAEVRATIVVVTFVLVVLGGLGALTALYVHDTRAAARRADAEKREAVTVFAQMSEARNRPEAEKDRAVEKLLVAKHDCEVALDACSDAGGVGAKGRSR